MEATILANINYMSKNLTYPDKTTGKHISLVFAKTLPFKSISNDVEMRIGTEHISRLMTIEQVEQVIERSGKNYIKNEPQNQNAGVNVFQQIYTMLQECYLFDRIDDPVAAGTQLALSDFVIKFGNTVESIITYDVIHQPTQYYIVLNMVQTDENKSRRHDVIMFYVKSTEDPTISSVGYVRNSF